MGIEPLYKQGTKFSCASCGVVQGYLNIDKYNQEVLFYSDISGIDHSGWSNAELFNCKNCNEPLMNELNLFRKIVDE